MKKLILQNTGVRNYVYIEDMQQYHANEIANRGTKYFANAEDFLRRECDLRNYSGHHMVFNIISDEEAEEIESLRKKVQELESKLEELV